MVDEASHMQWLEWARRDYVPAVMATGCFHTYRILHVMDSPNEGITYCIQYNTDSITEVNNFYNQHLPALQAGMQAAFENKFVVFNTLMQSVE